MNFDEAMKRYQTDDTFHVVVDHIQKLIDGMHLSPYELRDAAMLAAYLHAMSNPIPVRMVFPEEPDA